MAIDKIVNTTMDERIEYAKTVSDILKEEHSNTLAKLNCTVLSVGYDVEEPSGVNVVLYSDKRFSSSNKEILQSEGLLKATLPNTLITDKGLYAPIHYSYAYLR